jgi:hypothetical protein
MESKMNKEDAIEILRQSSETINTQDNRITAEPIFMVQEKHWRNSTVYVNIQPFFTEKAAQEYINANRHNLVEPRIYVESGYRNYEWQAVRTLLKTMED